MNNLAQLLKMNVIAYFTYDRYISEGLTRALLEQKLDKVFVIEHETDQCKDYPNLYSRATERYDNTVIHTANYKGKLENDSLIPIDSALMKAFEPYMLFLIKLIERNQFYDVSFEERLAIALTHIEYWNTVIERQKVDLFVTNNVPHNEYQYTLYALCKIKGVKFICIYNSPVPGYSYVLDNIDNHAPEIAQVYSRLKNKFAETDIADIPLDALHENVFVTQSGNDSAQKIPSYMLDGSVPCLIEKPETLKDKLTTLKYILDIFLNFRDWYSYFLRYTKYVNGKNYFKNWNSLIKPYNMTKEKYFYFPLHYQPEATTMPLGGYYVWQLFAIKMINACLPKDVFLYVKENPKQGIQARTLDFPQTLASLSQVKLMPRQEDTYQLSAHSIATASIIGTAIWEGLFMGKPALMFGNFITEHAPGVFKVATNADCKRAIDKILSTNCCPTHKDMKIFLCAMQEISTKGFTCRPPLVENMDYEILTENMHKLFTHSFNKILPQSLLNSDDNITKGV